METIKDLTNQVYEKLSRELRQYRRELREKSVDTVMLNSYETAIKEQLPDIFSNTHNYSRNELKALLELDSTLDALYNTYYYSNSQLGNFIEDSIEDYINDLSEEYKLDLEEKIEKDKNFELIDNISSALDDFDFYELCYSIKNKFNVDEFGVIEVNEMMKERDGIRYLYHFFDELKDNEHLQYLNETMVINSENYNNITEKILPKLKELIQERSKNNKGYER